MFLKYLLNIFNPQPLIGGLEISDSDLRFILIKGKNLKMASVKLPPKIVEMGKIKDGNNLKTAILKLRSQITSRSKKKIYVVLSISDANIYNQIFRLPIIAADNLEEAARLNLEMISPTDFSTVYSDWQKVGEIDIDGGQLEIFSAFINRQIIDEFIKLLKETHFVVVAIEYPSLALTRLLGGARNIINPSVLLRLAADGLSFSIIKNNNLYFNHFVSWPGEERQISLNDLKDLIVRETQKIINFSNNHWPDISLNNMILVTPALEEKVSQIITENFNLSIQKLTLPQKLASPNNGWSIVNNQLTTLPPEWFGVLGSALRGLIPRSKDIVISLASVGTEEEFRQQRIIAFIKLWRNIILTCLSFILAAFVSVDVFLKKNADALNNQIANLSGQSEIGVFDNLQKDAKDFNSKIDLALQAKNQTVNWSPLFEKLQNLTGQQIIIDRIFIQSAEMPILFNGRATNQQAIIDFKKLLEQDSSFSEINLPLSNISSGVDGLLNFSITFKYNVSASKP